MKSELGRFLKVILEGESHADFVRCTVKGLPANFKADENELRKFMLRRQGGNSSYVTKRKEKDEPIFESGIEDFVTNGEDLKVKILNNNVKSADYSKFSDTPRPSHIDYVAKMRYGANVDIRGGGHFSARLTAPMCVCGNIVKQILEKQGIKIFSRLKSVGNVKDIPIELTENDESKFRYFSEDFPVISQKAADEMKNLIKKAAENGDSVGAEVETFVLGMPKGVGDPIFYGMENCLSMAMFGLGGVRSIEFGKGAEASHMYGSEHNDAYTVENGGILTKTNNCGGIIGGITTGMPVVFNLVFKPTASIAKKQKTVSVSRMEETEIEIKGRHDSCIGVRAVPCVEALTALTLGDLIISKYGKLDFADLQNNKNF